MKEHYKKIHQRPRADSAARGIRKQRGSISAKA